MSTKKKAMFVTGTRAEYGLLKPLIYELDKYYSVNVVVTGMHLSPEFGMTVEEIKNDGIRIEEEVEILLSSDTTSGIVKSMGIGLISFADVFERINPDVMVILGDRFEILSAVVAASVMKIPIVHLHGGEITEGAIDDNIRHAITKLSHIHFCSTEVYRKRVIQLGEHPDTVFNVGAIGLDNILSTKMLSRDEIQKELGIEFRDKVFLITYHPVTLELYSIEKQVSHLFEALSEVENTTLIFTKANADAQGRYINDKIENWVKDREDAYVFSSLGSLRYLSLVKNSDVVIGNSSSGIIEVPSFHVPTINIGNRQKGRIRAGSVLDCGYSCGEIRAALNYSQSESFREDIKKMDNPYGTGTTALKISTIMKDLDYTDLIPKQFYDLTYPEVINSQ